MSPRSRTRRRLAAPAVALGLALPLAVPAAGQEVPPAPTSVVDLGVVEVDALLDDGATTSVDLVRQYLRRIAAYEEAYGDEPGVNAVITVNPRALAEAAAADAERLTGTDRGPLHGVPVLVKDNFDTFDLPTTAGSLPLASMQAPDDATQVARLREAGAIVIAKANLHEFAGSWETVSSLGGQTRNPYDQAHFPGGSSGGTGAGVAASFAAVGMGSDTCGSIRVPSANSALVGLRATQGLTSQDGIFPMSATQDVGGPMAKSVADVAIVLDATAGSDPKDPATADADQHVPDSYLDGLDVDALDGARIGILTDLLGTEPEELEVSALTRAAADDMEALGATVVELGPQAALFEAVGEASVLVDEMDRDTAAYFAAPGLELPEGLAELTEPTDAVTLSDVFATGEVHPALEWMLAIFEVGELPTSEYEEHLAQRAAAQVLLAGLLADNELDAVVYPSMTQPPAAIETGFQPGVNCQLSAHTGFPALSLPAGFTTAGLPVGIELLSAPYSEPALLALGYAYEQGTGHRVPPASTPEVDVAACGDPAGEPAFPDVAGTTHEGAIDCLAAFEVVAGFGDGTYRPAATTSRGQAASLLYEALVVAGVPAVVDAEDAFGDDDGSVHEDAIDALAALGVLQGRDGAVLPGQAVSRGQLASMINRSLAHVLAVTPAGATDAFADDDGSVHEPAIDALAGWGVYRGTEGGQADAGATVTRGQAASLLVRSLL